MLQTWTEVLTQSFQQVWMGIVEFVPNIIVAILIFIIGWLIGAAIGRVIAQIISALKIDNALKSAGVEDLLERAGYALDSGRFIGLLVKWFIIVVFLVAAVDVLGLSQINAFLKDVVLAYLPQVIVAVVILLIAAVVAELLRSVVIGAARALGAEFSKFLGSVARWSVWVFAILAALNQLGVAQQFVQTLFTGAVATLVIAFGLAFGLGGREEAAKLLAKVRKEVSERESEDEE